MQLGILGMPMVGKTTIFELLTENIGKVTATGKTNTAMARIPDYRVDKLSDYYKPKKTTYAQLEIVDIPGLVPGGEKSTAVFLEAVRQADALLLVIRAFANGLSDQVDPVGDIETLNYELLLADLDLIEKRMKRIDQSKKRKQLEKERSLLEKFQNALENEKHLSAVELDDEEQEIMKAYQFLTNKPVLICLNLAEDDMIEKTYPGREELLIFLQEHGLKMVEVSAEIEKEIAELDGDEKDIFMQELNLTESGVLRIARSIYESLGLISFITSGEDEVKAWTIKKGTVARSAAGKIHSDIERGFIRAEVIKYEDFIQHGSMNAVKEKGLFKLEGKEYLVQDGDLINFRFNV
ncbi:gtp-binding and nucleic acid-binding protein ychf [hydrocarbon metagenome]|uniref:Gtp-binding and nucleic acid-binding protein ychf n=1 Tax=hydrocarbon metagenome TaxID=938273 RepID=A0A0W8E6Z7_9ZZZZ